MKNNFKMLFFVFWVTALLTACGTVDPQNNAALESDMEQTIPPSIYNNKDNTETENCTEMSTLSPTERPLNDRNFLKNASKISNEHIFFSIYNGVYIYDNNEIRKIDNGYNYPIVKENDGYTFWVSPALEENGEYTSWESYTLEEKQNYGIVVYDIENNKYDFFKAEGRIIDLWVEDGYIIYSAHNSYYSIYCIDMSDGFQTVVVGSVCEEVDFSYYNKSIYFTDAHFTGDFWDSFRIYKYDLEDKTTMLIDSVKNDTTLQMDIAIDETGIFYTYTKNYANVDLYKFDWRSEKSVLIRECVSGPERLGNYLIYMSGNNSIYEYNLKNNEETKIITLDKRFYGQTVNEKYIVYLSDREDKTEVYVYDRLTGETKMFNVL